MVHVVTHSFSTAMVLSLANAYFRTETCRVQMIGFMIITNQGHSDLLASLFNDSFIEFLVFGSFCCLAKSNRPLLASALLSLAISIKVGPILLLPCFFGWIQFSNGTIALFASVIIIITIQALLAAPFLSTYAARMMGWPNASSTIYMYLVRSKIIPSKVRDRNMAAMYEWSKWWTFIDEELFYKTAWLDFLKQMILVVNVYYFFIRRNCLP